MTSTQKAIINGFILKYITPNSITKLDSILLTLSKMNQCLAMESNP